MLGRFMNLIKAMFSKSMSKLETPEVLAEQALDELESSVKKVQDAVVSSLTNEKQLEAQLKKNNEELASWDKRAAVAVSQDNEDLARQCLQKKQEIKQNIAMLTQQVEDQKKNTAALKQRFAELQEQLRTFNQKKDNLTARSNASDAVSKANLLLSDNAGGGTAKWEQKIAEKEYKAAALQQMGSEPTADKFKELDQKIEVDDELAALKAKMNQPKLIVDTGGGAQPAKTVVDENLPMVVDVEDAGTDETKK